MRRTVLSAMALACTAVLAGAVPAFADGASTPAPSARPAPTRSATAAPSARPAPTRSATAAPSPVPTRASAPRGVTVVPKGAPDTGVPPVETHSGGHGGLIGGSAAAVLAAGGATVLFVRRRRTTGA